VVLQHGTVPADPGWLVVDCSASAIQKRPNIPVFQGHKITTQFVRTVQPTFSAALIAHIEATIDDEAEKNQICTVVPLPDVPADWLKMLAVNMGNQQRWSQVKGLQAWVAASRLDGFSGMARRIAPDDLEKLAVLKRFGANTGPAAQNMPRLLAMC
jgi:hypothetical protein